MDGEAELRAAREQGALQAARSEVSTLQALVERQRLQIEKLLGERDAARAEAGATRAEVERLRLVEIELRGKADAGSAAHARVRQLQGLLDESNADAKSYQLGAEKRINELEVELRRAKRLATEARRSAAQQAAVGADPAGGADQTDDTAWQRQMESLCLGGGSNAMKDEIEQARSELARNAPPEAEATRSERSWLLSRQQHARRVAAEAAEKEQGLQCRRREERQQYARRHKAVQAEASAMYDRARAAAAAAARQKVLQQELLAEAERTASARSAAASRLRHARSQTMPSGGGRQMSGTVWTDMGAVEYRMSTALLDQLQRKISSPLPVVQQRSSTPVRHTIDELAAPPGAIAAAMLHQAGLAGTDYAQLAVLSGPGSSPSLPSTACRRA